MLSRRGIRHGVAHGHQSARCGIDQVAGGARGIALHNGEIFRKRDVGAQVVDGAQVIGHDGQVLEVAAMNQDLLQRSEPMDDEVLADGHVGRIALVSPSRMVGFLGEPEKSREVLGDDYVLTGDLGYLRAGELFWVGRDREQINLSGMKYDPSDFEAALNQIDALRKGCFAAFGVEDEELGTQRLVVLCELRSALEGDGVELCASIRASVASNLGISVSEVVLTARGQLTKTSSGKRRHLHFRDEYLAGNVDVLVRDF